VGLVVLLAGLGASFMIERRPDLMTPLLIGSYVCLMLGLVATTIAAYTGDRWIREPRADQSLGRALKGLNKKYKLYNYLLPAEHVLLSPLGVTVLKVKRQDGRIEYQDGLWRHRQGLLRTFFSLSRERLGDPMRELAWEMERMQEFVQEKLPDAEVPVSGLVVFTSPKAELHIVNPPLPAVPLKKLKAQLRSLGKTHKVSDTVRRELEQVFDEATST
jgi:hypothetical protein